MRQPIRSYLYDSVYKTGPAIGSGLVVAEKWLAADCKKWVHKQNKRLYLRRTLIKPSYRIFCEKRRNNKNTVLSRTLFVLSFTTMVGGESPMRIHSCGAYEE